MKTRYPFIVIAVIFVFCMTTFVDSMVEARGGRGGGGRGGGGRGGGGFSRRGPAASGGFSSRPAGQSRMNQAPRQETRREQPRVQDRDRDDRQERRDEIREDRQEYREDAREDRQDFIEDERDDYYDDYYDDHYHYGGVAFVTYAPCSTTVVVGGSTYYHCDSTWYSRGYQGGDVVYIVTSAPAGY
jgi:hypothetical protein